jgi:hypothetical protein
MSGESVIVMAREAGFMLRSESVEGESDWWECFDEEIERFAKLVVDDYNNNKPWVGLTEEEVEQIVDGNTHNAEGYQFWCSGKGVAAIVEAKLKEKHMSGDPVSVKDMYEGAPPETHKPWVGLTPEDYDSIRSRVPHIVNDFALADVVAIVESKLEEKNCG